MVYMSFHKEDRAKYVESGQRLADETLKSLADYFDNIFNSQVADGSLAKKRKCQIEQCVRCEMRHEFCKRYNEKVRQVTEQHYGGDSCHYKWPDKYRCNNFKWQDCGNRDRCDTYAKCNKKWDDKTPPDRSNKVFKPCSVHGPKSKQPLRSATRRTQGMTKVNFKTRSAPMKRIVRTRATQVTMMNCALARIHRSQVRIRHQLQARARRIMKMRTIIFMFLKK
jgi:hypothetical protein